MTKRIEAKSKICRRLGVNLWGRPKNPLARRDYAPGEHGQKRRKLSDYALQLAAKQKLRRYYANMTERQFRRAYETASRQRGDTAENLIGLLERRLDTVVYRVNLAPTPFASRQLVNHGHVLVNGKRVSLPSRKVLPGEVVAIAERSRTNAQIMLAAQASPRAAGYLEVNAEQFSARLRELPEADQIPVLCSVALVVEYYSR